jgi:trehalose/maltose hydrolase-like predicted phosphorylase
VPEDYLARNFDYYIERTSHGSTLSRLVHARLAWEMERRETGWSLYMDALRSDLVDIQGGTTGEGIHCGVMAGTVCDVIYTFGGLNLKGEWPSVDPALPSHWTGLRFRFTFRGVHYQVVIDGKEVKISQREGGKEKIKVHLCGKEEWLGPGDEATSVSRH